MTSARTPEDRCAPIGGWRAIYWKGPTAAFQAWSPTIISLVLVVGNIAAQYGINVWNRHVFQRPERHDQTIAGRAIVLLFNWHAALVAVLQPDLSA